MFFVWHDNESFKNLSCFLLTLMTSLFCIFHSFILCVFLAHFFLICPFYLFQISSFHTKLKSRLQYKKCVLHIYISSDRSPSLQKRTTTIKTNNHYKIIIHNHRIKHSFFVAKLDFKQCFFSRINCSNCLSIG